MIFFYPSFTTNVFFYLGFFFFGLNSCLSGFCLCLHIPFQSFMVIDLVSTLYFVLCGSMYIWVEISRTNDPFRLKGEGEGVEGNKLLLVEIRQGQSYVVL